FGGRRKPGSRRTARSSSGSPEKRGRARWTRSTSQCGRCRTARSSTSSLPTPAPSCTRTSGRRGSSPTSTGGRCTRTTRRLERTSSRGRSSTASGSSRTRSCTSTRGGGGRTCASPSQAGTISSSRRGTGSGSSRTISSTACTAATRGTMESFRFLFATSFYPPYHLGGDAVHVQYLARALAARGHEVHVEFSPAAYRLKRKEEPRPARDEEGIQVHAIPSRFGRAQPMAAYLLGRSRGVARFHDRLLRETRPDVVHLH